MKKNVIIIITLIGIMVLGSASTFVNVSALSLSPVPSWVKSIASWWSEGKISDEEILMQHSF